jgi:hypothetical protein
MVNLTVSYSFAFQDGFRFPSQAFYDDLVANQQLSKLDLDTYVHILKAVFEAGGVNKF